MTAAPLPPPQPPEKRVRALRYRSLENHYRSEDALDRGDLAEFTDRRHTARLERDLADDVEMENE